MHSPNRCTKGPWAIESCGTGEPDSRLKDSNGATYQPDSAICTLRADGTKKRIAHIYCGTGCAVSGSDGYLPTPAAIAEQTANAHLIAAAPELYEALTHALEDLTLVRKERMAPDDLGGIIIEVRNALKKADGPMDYSGCYVCGHAPLEWEQRGDGEAQEDGVTGRVYCSAVCMDKDHAEGSK